MLMEKERMTVPAVSTNEEPGRPECRERSSASRCLSLSASSLASWASSSGSIGAWEKKECSRISRAEGDWPPLAQPRRKSGSRLISWRGGCERSQGVRVEMVVSVRVVSVRV